MPTITDEEFGEISVRRSSKASQLHLRVAPDGTLKISVPFHAPMFLVKNMIKGSRNEIREILSKAKPEYEYTNGMQIGKSHTLVIQIIDNTTSPTITIHGLQIIIKTKSLDLLKNPSTSRDIRDTIIKALRVEAKSYLPKRLSFLAEKHGFSYSKTRFSHSSSRWGSCSSNGTISLNIALMKLPFDLIDYVIIHELSHTRQMNHSPAFWDVVAESDPNYKTHRKLLKLQNPSI